MSALTVLTSEIRQHDGLYSLNDLHQAAGGTAKHRPNQFMRLDTTKALIEEIHCADLRSATRSINGGPHRGTYVCKELVYAYAMWVSPSFHLKVIRAFDARCPEAGQVQRAVTYAGMVAGLIQHELVKAILANPAADPALGRWLVTPDAGRGPQVTALWRPPMTVAEFVAALGRPVDRLELDDALLGALLAAVTVQLRERLGGQGG